MSPPVWVLQHHLREHGRERRRQLKINSKDSLFPLKKKQGGMTPVHVEVEKNSKNAVEKQAN